MSSPAVPESAQPAGSFTRPGPDDAPAPPGGRRGLFHRLRVSAVDQLTDQSVAVTFDVPEELREAYRFTAGQHLALRVPGRDDDVRRTYSICQPAPRGDAPPPERLRVAVKRVPGGAFSEYATTRLAAGDQLEALPPAGRFTPATRATRHAAVVGGSGITPVFSLVSTVLRADPAAHFTLLRSERSAASTMFLDEVEELKDRHPGRLQLLHLFSREEQRIGLESGRPDAERLAALLPALLPVTSVDAWYLCGPYGLIRAAEQALRQLSVPRQRVHEEIFHVDEAPAAGADGTAAAAGTGQADGDTTSGDTTDGDATDGTRRCEITATLDGRASTFRADHRTRLLDALLEQRSDAPFACRGGVCGTCRAMLVDGEVRMERNFALEPEETAAGYVLTCQSHPLTPSVRVDYDA